MLHRRTVLKQAGAAAGLAMVGGRALAGDAETFAPRSCAWRSFEIRTLVELPPTKGPARVWVPTPSVAADGRRRPGGVSFTGNADRAELIAARAGMVSAEWKSGASAPRLEVVCYVSTRDGAVVSQGRPAKLSADERGLYVATTSQLPTEAAAKTRLAEITANASDDREKARAIYGCVEQNTACDARARGCGLADFDALYVALARAAGLPVRLVFGLWIPPSRSGEGAAAASAETVTGAQSSRAEVWLDGAGWVPVDPVSARQTFAMDDAEIAVSRNASWLAYNDAEDVTLPGARAQPLAFFIHPQAETVAGLANCLDPERLRYSITAREVTA